MKLRDSTSTLYHCNYFPKPLLQSYKDLKLVQIFFPPQQRPTIIFYLPVGKTHHYFVYFQMISSLGHESFSWHPALLLLLHALTRIATFER